MSKKNKTKKNKNNHQNVQNLKEVKAENQKIGKVHIGILVAMIIAALIFVLPKIQ